VTGAPVPLFVMEEHHEAFLVWKIAITQGIIPSGGLTLLHVDEHSDMSVPRLRVPFERGAAIADIAAFTYDELDIGNFIWAAVHDGVLSGIAWLRTWHPAPRSRREMFMCAANRQGTEFMTGARSAIPWDAKDVSLAVYETLSPADVFSPAGPVILDIDLDYFSSLPYPEYENSRVEITARAYEDFLNNPYHILRISPGGKVGVERENGCFYLVFNDFPAQKPRTSLEAIDRRVTEFFAFLDRNKVCPPLIDVCRSRYSGYTPKEHVDRIQYSVLAGLAERYATVVQSVPVVRSMKEAMRI
jgi:UPF0489 domain